MKIAFSSIIECIVKVFLHINPKSQIGDTADRHLRVSVICLIAYDWAKAHSFMMVNIPNVLSCIMIMGNHLFAKCLCIKLTMFLFLVPDAHEGSFVSVASG